MSEPLVRAAAIAAWFLGKDREGVELVLRGAIGLGRHCRLGRHVRFVGPPRNFGLGARVTLYGNTILNATGRGGRLDLGSGSHVDHYCVLYGQGGLRIGLDCAVAAGVLIYSQTNADSAVDGTPVAAQPTRYAPVTIGDGCWLGAGASILPGVVVGERATVGAGAVVTREVRPRATVAGVPARPLDTVRS